MSIPQVVEAFVFVSTRSAKNRFLQKLGRLKQPRYALSAFVGILYFVFVFGRNMFRHRSPSNFRTMELAGGDMFVSAGSMIVLFLLIAAWALPDSSGGVTFAPAEIQFLFPAPLRRWQLLLYKVLRSQPQILFTSAIMTFLGFRRGHFVGVWAAVTVLNIYLMMVSLGRARLQLAGARWLARLAIVLVLLAGIIGIVAAQYPPSSLSGSKAFLRTNHDPGELTGLTAPFHRTPLSALFLFPRLLIEAVLPGDMKQLFTSVFAVLIAGVLSFLLAARFDVSFEEASITASQKRADVMKSRRGTVSGRAVVFRKAPQPFKLHPTGIPEVAILWKNLIAVGRVSGRTLLILLLSGFSVVGGLAATAHTQHSIEVLKVAGVVMLCFGLFFMVFAPLTMKADLRLDQRRFDYLKTLPISGERLIAAGVGAPLVVIVLAEAVMLSVGVLLLRSGELLSSAQVFFSTPQFVIMTLIFLTPITAIQLLLHNAVVVLLPGWTIGSKEDMKGIAATGQGILVLAGHIMALGLIVLPAAMVFLPSLWIAHHFFAGNAGSIVVATMPPLAVMVGELLLAVRFLGRQFDELDLANDVHNLEAE
ncbi:MAG TPA: putative ABC exporter domain-containing protein [Thermoanaerobaculia bacterium]|nr:putative ABC exporter domain-containing protein [Thermoanaerobaculia bacterium]